MFDIRLRRPAAIVAFIIALSISMVMIYNFTLQDVEGYKDMGYTKQTIQGTLDAKVSVGEIEIQPKVRACLLVLVRNSELHDWRESMVQMEDRFNRRHNYPYVFLNEVPFTEEFKKNVLALTNATVEFGLIPQEHWSYPKFVDLGKAKESRIQMKAQDVMYGDMESYHHMCRFNSGFFFHHPLTHKYDFYWRIEPGIKYYCDIDFDPFRVMKAKNISYAFTISLYEFQNTIPTLWQTTLDWLKDNRLSVNQPHDNALEFISDDNGKSYNLCHFWSNFEIASFKLWRSKEYMSYFDYLDKKGGFFYERWGDAPVHSIYAALRLPKDQIHFFNDIGYYHGPYSHCPTDPDLNAKCHCDPEINFDYDGYSCTSKFIEMKNRS